MLCKSLLILDDYFSCRFSPDEETSMGLVQHEGGPCGVLAALQVNFLSSQFTFFGESMFHSRHTFICFSLNNINLKSA